MAHKRMFSKDITTSDAFREMPASSQALYFHLGMEADDDGFLDNYKGLMRSINASEDDLRVLLGKRFLILFPSKVVVVKHWLINNTLRKDRYTETKHLDEKRALIVKENGSYTELPESGIPSGNQVATQYRIEEERITSSADAPQVVRVSENGEERPKRESTAKYNNARVAFKWFPRPEPSWLENTTELKCGNLLFNRGESAVKGILDFLEKHKGSEYLSKGNKPSSLERNWIDIQDWADRNGL